MYAAEVFMLLCFVYIFINTMNFDWNWSVNKMHSNIVIGYIDTHCQCCVFFAKSHYNWENTMPHHGTSFCSTAFFCAQLRMHACVQTANAWFHICIRQRFALYSMLLWKFLHIGNEVSKCTNKNCAVCHTLSDNDCLDINTKWSQS